MIDLCLRNLTPTDADDLHVIAAQWPVVRQLGGWPWPANLAFTASRSVPYTGQGFVWGVEAAGKIIGSVAVTRGELGYMIHQDYWQRGIGKTNGDFTIQMSAVSLEQGVLAHCDLHK